MIESYGLNDQPRSVFFFTSTNVPFMKNRNPKRILRLNERIGLQINTPVSQTRTHNFAIDFLVRDPLRAASSRYVAK